MFNPRVAIVTKAPINKSIMNMFKIDKTNSFFAKMTMENYTIGKTFQKIALNYFSKVDLFQLDEVFELYNSKNKCFDNYDLIVPIGGDGTFLSCSHFLPDNKKFIFGINSNPSSSLGFLLDLNYEDKFEEKVNKALHNIQRGHYEILHRKRFEVFFKLPKETIRNNIICDDNYLIGLNDLFYGSLNQAATASYLFGTNENELSKLKSTGCLVYTGSGSSAWALSLNHLSESSIISVLEYLKIEPKQEIISEIQQYNESKIQFNPAFNKLAYKHREMGKINSGVSEEGSGMNFLIVNKTVGAFVAVDGFEHNLEMDEQIEINLSSADKDLLCIKVNEFLG